MIKEAIDRIIQLATPPVSTVDEIPYWTASGQPVKPPSPNPLLVHTLSALAEYLTKAVDGPGREYFVHINSPARVNVFTPVDGSALCRAHWLIAEPASCWARYGAYRALEDFIIDLQANFEDVGDRSLILRLLGNIDEQEARTDQDDGVTQHVSARRGVHLVGDETIQNPVTLAPFRTFPEVEQPASPFILRLKGGERKEAALFPADGDAWQLKAIESIALVLSTDLPKGVTILA